MSAGKVLAQVVKVASRIPWKEILKAIGALGPVARQIYKDFKDSKAESAPKSSKKESISVETLRGKVLALETFVNHQSELNTRLTDQLGILAEASTTVSSRLSLFMWIASAQMVLILILLVRVFLV